MVSLEFARAYNIFVFLEGDHKYLPANSISMPDS